MISRLFWLTCLSLPLLSCSINGSSMQGVNNGNSTNQNSQSAMSRMAQSRGINTRVIDSKLNDLMVQANSIELQMASLSKTLNDLRSDIAGFDRTMVEELPVVSAASEKPQIILPVPTRKKAQIKKTVKPKKSKPSIKITTSNKKGVVGVRYGAHKTKTRFVLDINGATKHNIDFDKEVGIVTISLPNTPWSTTKKKTYKSSQLVGFEAKPTDKGTIIALSVKGTSSVRTETLKKTKSKPARLIIDLIK